MVKRSVVLKLTLLVKRKEGISFEDFDNHWTNNHGPLLASIPIFKEKLIKYTQLGHSKQNKEADDIRINGLSQVVHMSQKHMNIMNGLPMMKGYDGIMEAYAEKMEDFEALFECEEYKSIIMPDEDLFVDRSQCQMFIGYEEMHWDNEEDKSTSS